MKKALVVALLLSLTPAAFAQTDSPAPAATAAPSTVRLPPVAKADKMPTPTPAPTPLPTEPNTPAEFNQLLMIFVLAVQQAVSLGTLGAVLFASLALTYVLMYLAKSGLKQNLPEHYKKALPPLLVVLTGVAAGLGYYLGGPAAAVAAGSGAAVSSISHDVIDALRYGPRKKA